MKLFTAYNPPVTIHSPTGSRVEIEYKLVKDSETGASKLVEIGKTNVYDSIQSWSNACDIQTRLTMFANGDSSALNGATGGIYGDISNAPHSFIEAQQKAIDADEMFNRLPFEVKSAFGSFSQFKEDYMYGNLDVKLNNHLNKISLDKAKSQEVQSDAE